MRERKRERERDIKTRVVGGEPVLIMILPRLSLGRRFWGMVKKEKEETWAGWGKKKSG